jgi:RimJ/RimL family protein N-acetyltransferase
MVTLRPMTDAEFAEYLRVLRVNYAQERADSANTPLEEEQAESDRQISQLLPEGLRSPGHSFWNVVDEASGNTVGTLWVFEDAAKHRAFIYGIEMSADQRGKGYGTAALAALEETLRSRGVTRIALNVFGKNTGAQRLYARVGYYPIAVAMQKDL